MLAVHPAYGARPPVERPHAARVRARLFPSLSFSFMGEHHSPLLVVYPLFFALDGVKAPAIGTPNLFLELATSTTLKFFTFDLNFAGGSTFSGPTTLTVASFREACSAELAFRSQELRKSLTLLATG